MVIEESKILRGLGNGIVEIQDLAWTWRGCRGFEHWVKVKGPKVRVQVAFLCETIYGA